MTKNRWKMLRQQAMLGGIIACVLMLNGGCRSTPVSDPGLGNIGESAGPGEGELVVQRPVDNGKYASYPIKIFIDGQHCLSLGNFQEGMVILPNGKHIMLALVVDMYNMMIRSINIPITVNSNRITFTVLAQAVPFKGSKVEIEKISEVALGGTKAAKTVEVVRKESSTKLPSSNSSGEVSDKVYVGVVAFNNQTSEFVLSNRLGEAKSFINSKENDIDSTSLCYAISKATTLFGASDLPALDNTFVVSFTDGVDNSSSNLYSNVPQAQVYDKAKADLSGISGVKSYAIGFGSSLNATNMEKLVVNGGEYKTANASNLDQVFQEIANSVLAASKNVVLVTQNGTYTEEYPKYFRITVNASSTAASSSITTSRIKCKLVRDRFTVIEPSANVSFVAPATGTVVGGKMQIPLNNLKYMSDGREFYIQSINVEVSFSENSGYYEDVEDSSASTDVSKKIGVVLVLDCSTSLGEAFASVQDSANNFINTLMRNTQ